jgi:parallel beta-helix repeat protein
MFSNCSIFKNGFCGIQIFFCDRNSNNKILNCRIANNEEGIYLYYSSDTIIINNSLFHRGINTIGDHSRYFNSHTIEDNFLDNHPIYYFVNMYDYDILLPSDKCHLILANCSNQLIKNYELYGLILWYCSDINISRNIFKDITVDGIILIFSNFNQISKNKFVNNTNGIFLVLSYENEIEENIMSFNEQGILLIASSGNIIKNNSCNNNMVDGIGITINSRDNNIQFNNCTNNMKGIAIRESMNNKLDKNICIRNHHGIMMNDAFNTIIDNNLLRRNRVGIYFHNATNNIISHNIIDFNSHKGITLRNNSNKNIIENNQIGPWNYQGLYLEQSNQNIIRYNNIERNNDDGIGLLLAFFNKINYNNIIDNTDHALEGGFCFNNARNNYWGHNPIRWFFNNECDIYTPGGFVAIHPFLVAPVET